MGDLSANSLDDLINLVQALELKTAEFSIVSALRTRVVNALSTLGVGVAGTDTQVQFNDGGVLAGNSGLLFDKVTGKLSVQHIERTSIVILHSTDNDVEMIAGGGNTNCRFFCNTNEENFQVASQGTMVDGDTAIKVVRRIGAAFTIQRVSMGVADSGGGGFKLLRVPN